MIDEVKAYAFLLALAAAIVLGGCDGGVDYDATDEATEDVVDQVFHPIDDGRPRTDIECVWITGYRKGGLSCHWSDDGRQ